MKSNKKKSAEKRIADVRKKKRKEKARFCTRHNPLRHDVLQISKVQWKDHIDL